MWNVYGDLSSHSSSHTLLRESEQWRELKKKMNIALTWVMDVYSIAWWHFCFWSRGSTRRRVTNAHFASLPRSIRECICFTVWRNAFRLLWRCIWHFTGRTRLNGITYHILGLMSRLMMVHNVTHHSDVAEMDAVTVSNRGHVIFVHWACVGLEMSAAWLSFIRDECVCGMRACMQTLLSRLGAGSIFFPDIFPTQNLCIYYCAGCMYSVRLKHFPI